MYFTDLTNSELERYHDKARLDSFSVNITTMMGSNLFKDIELNNGLFKIIPLFYVSEIRCNDSDVRIFSNKALIMDSSNTSYVDFITDETIYYVDEGARENYIPPYPVGEDLTEAQFNNLVYLMRKNTVFKDEFRVKQSGKVSCEFGEYTFSMTLSNIIDKGIVLTRGRANRTRAPTPPSSVIKCELTNPYFHEHTYTLVLTLRSIKDVNLDKEHISDDNIIEREVRTDLIPNTEVTVNWNTSQDETFNEVILYDARVEIRCTKPLIDMGD